MKPVQIPQEFNRLAIRRTNLVLNRIKFDASIKDMLAHAYTIGFFDAMKAAEKRGFKE